MIIGSGLLNGNTFDRGVGCVINLASCSICIDVAVCSAGCKQEGSRKQLPYLRAYIFRIPAVSASFEVGKQRYVKDGADMKRTKTESG
jgi:hypothetical protein